MAEVEKKEQENINNDNIDKIEEIIVKYSLPILQVAKTSQFQNGLRNGNYNRYRNYCSKRLHKLRKFLNLQHGKSEKSFVKKKYDIKNIDSERYLLIPLFQAERAWSFGMEIREEFNDRDKYPRKYFHYIRKFKKAVKWAELLQTSSEEKGDDNTIYEARAYSHFMKGTLFIAVENWKEAMDQLIKSRIIYEKLSKSNYEDSHLYSERIEELNPNIKLCEYNISGKHANVSDILEFQLSNNPAFDLLKSKLEDVVKQSRQVKAERMTQINWKHENVPIKSEKTRMSMIAAQEIVHEIERDNSHYSKELSNLYTNLFMKYSDTLELIRNDIRDLKRLPEDKRSKKVETQEYHLNLLISYITYLKITKTIERDQLLVKSLESQLNSQGKKKSKPEDLVRIYDNLIQSTEQLEISDDIDQANQNSAKLLTLKAFRCYYIALYYLFDDKYSESIALLDHASNRARNATNHLNECENVNEDALLELKNLQKKIRGKKCVVSAIAFKNNVPENETENDDKNNNNNNPENENQDKKATIYQTIDTPIKIKDKKDVIGFPPDFELAFCKPTLFDLSLAEFTFPDLDDRVEKKKSFWKFW
eukprot:TRINITY_DN2635_c2_g1_i1.p2 TRINITY_DN2635_c2_g1~~TRINITY_DN2635_c2_g1_i1.p2  ORF type:complete len:591 (-),score=191.67 TRINITY_DN2635_c2_g1_i1:2098-3870(-)